MVMKKYPHLNNALIHKTIIDIRVGLPPEFDSYSGPGCLDRFLCRFLIEFLCHRVGILGHLPLGNDTE